MTARIAVDREKIAEFCRRHHIRRLALFGSVLRDDFGPDSDVDVLVEFEPGHIPGLEFFRMQEELSEILGESPGREYVAVPEELLDEIKAFVTSVVGAMGFEARIDVYDADGFIAVDVAPDNTALFIGQKGETIDALQFLLNSAVYRKRPFVKRIILDAEGYRQRRVEAIQGIAHRTARRAVRERRTVELPPMSASERRIVHLFLRDNPKVTTASEGTGENRRVRISPT